MSNPIIHQGGGNRSTHTSTGEDSRTGNIKNILSWALLPVTIFLIFLRKYREEEEVGTKKSRKGLREGGGSGKSGVLERREGRNGAETGNPAVGTTHRF